MMRINLVVTFEDGTTKELRVRPVTQVAFERAHNCSIAAIGDEKRVEHTYWLAWHADTRGAGDLDSWLETVDDITVDVSEPDPTNPAQPAT